MSVMSTMDMESQQAGISPSEPSTLQYLRKLRQVVGSKSQSSFVAQSMAAGWLPKNASYALPLLNDREVVAQNEQ